MKIAEAKAKQVWEYFSQICRIPRPSKHEEKIGEWLKGFAEKQNWNYRTDGAGNIVMKVPASKGYEKAAAVIIQSHMDMVCEKDPGTEHDFLKDPIQTVEHDGWLGARGTTLGADNGMGMALALAVGTEQSIKHGPLELLFTVDEETGLNGVKKLPEDFITGKILLNTDSEDINFATVGCAGGRDSRMEITAEWEETIENLKGSILKVKGLTGGHSGEDIHHQRANAIELLARVVDDIISKINLRIAAIEGGNAHNAIPRNAEAKLCMRSEDIDKAMKIIKAREQEFKKEYAATDKDLAVEWEQSDMGQMPMVFTRKCGINIVRLLRALPHGVERYSTEVKGLVETSTNLAVVKTEKDKVWIITSQRSSSASRQKALSEKVETIGKLAGAGVSCPGEYSAWQPNLDSPLLHKYQQLYQQLFGRDIQARIIHAGLECGVIKEKYPGMDIISIGPTIRDLHSPHERVNIESVDQFWQLLQTLLSDLK